MTITINPWCPRCGRAKAAGKRVCLACENEDLRKAITGLLVMLIDQTADDALASFEDKLADYTAIGLSEEDYQYSLAIHLLDYIRDKGNWEQAVDMLQGEEKPVKT